MSGIAARPMAKLHSERYGKYKLRDCDFSSACFLHIYKIHQLLAVFQASISGESKNKGFHRFWVLDPDGMGFLLFLFYRLLQFATCNIKENNFCVKIKYLCLYITKKKLTYVYKFTQAT